MKEIQKSSPKSNHFFGNTSTALYILIAALTILSIVSVAAENSALFLSLSGILFLIVVYAIFRFKEQNKLQERSAYKLWIAILVSGIFLRIFLGAAIYGYQTDISCFTGWAAISYNGGLDHFYTSGYFTDYPPLYMYILYVLGALGNALQLSSTVFLIKIPAILSDVLVAAFAYKIAKKLTDEKTALIAFACILLNPAIIANSAVWGQIDMIYTLLVVLCIYLLIQQKLAMTIILFVIAVLLKVQSILLFPLLLFVVIQGFACKNTRKSTFRQLLAGCGIGIGIGILLILPFGGGRPLTWIIDLYLGSLGGYHYAAVNAFNLFGLFGLNWVSLDATFLGLSYKIWGIIGIVAVSFYSAWLYCKNTAKENYFNIVAFLIFGIYIFSHSMHERYTFAVPVLLLYSYFYTKNKNIFYASLLASLSVLLNQYVALYYYSQFIPYPIMAILSICNLAVFIFTAFIITKNTLNRNQTKEVGL